MINISVIIPTYKPQAYIWECLDSLKNQTFDNALYEIIIILNGCCEPYKSQIEQYISGNMGNNEVVFIQTDKGGVSNARNIGIDIARGEYITFIDDDDLVSDKYLEELYKNATPNTVSLCYPYAFNDGNIKQQRKYSLTETYDYCTSNNKNTLTTMARKYFGGPCMKLIHKNIIAERRFNVNFKNHEDSIFMFLISDRIEYVSFTSKDAVYYRRVRANSAMTSHRSYWEIIRVTLQALSEYSQIYFHSITKYNANFFCTRIIGSIKGLFFNLLP